MFQIMLFICLFVGVVTTASADAYYADGKCPNPADHYDIPSPSPSPSPSPVPLTPEGNANLVDDTSGKTSEDKQFITVQSKNGNYFYLIIDRATDGSNTVHFLNKVDEADLMALIEQDEPNAPICVCEMKCMTGSIAVDCAVCINSSVECEGITPTCECKTKCELGAINEICLVCRAEMKKCHGEETKSEDDENSSGELEEQKADKNPMLMALLLAAIVGGGAYYYLKIHKKKQEAEYGNEFDDDPGEDDYEDFEYINEDKEYSNIEEYDSEDLEDDSDFEYESSYDGEDLL